jgi:hypothetical protein
MSFGLARARPEKIVVRLSLFSTPLPQRRFDPLLEIVNGGLEIG